MHPFPPSSDLDFLLAGDSRLSQIVIDPHQLTLVFDNGSKVVSEHRAKFENGGRLEVYNEWRDVPSVSLHQLLECRLLSATTDNLVLTLEFEGDARVRIYSDLTNFEAGQMYRPDGSLIAF